MSTIAIMQPYFMPYIGYFQMIGAADTFVVYDDVNFIKKGWINRNNILVNGKPHLFSLPLENASQHKLINETAIDQNTGWGNKFVKTLQLSYKKAPFFAAVFPLVNEIVMNRETNLAKYVAHSLHSVCSYLEIETNIIISSHIEKNNNFKGQDKIIEICTNLNASRYVNAIGGVALYNKEAFSYHQIDLKFIRSMPIVYSQFSPEFIPNLSIIDVMMFNSPTEIQTMLKQYQLV
jgi:hypothetical protein